MKNLWIGWAAVTALAGCASYPAPIARMTDAEVTTRSADEIGAGIDPEAQIYLRRAREQMVRAREAMNDGDNHRADFMLVRAKADADLAFALAHEQRAETAAQQALDELAALQSSTPSTTSVTGAPAPAAPPKPAPPPPKPAPPPPKPAPPPPKPEGEHR
jgi:hypothetical protein